MMATQQTETAAVVSVKSSSDGSASTTDSVWIFKTQDWKCTVEMGQWSRPTKKSVMMATNLMMTDATVNAKSKMGGTAEL